MTHSAPGVKRDALDVGRIVMAAGGTGGHVFPAFALAEELVRRGIEVVWFGRSESIESDLAQRHGFAFEPIPAAGLSGKRMLERFRWPAVLLRGLVRSYGLLRALRPAAVIAAGGYVGVAPLFCAQVLGQAFFLLEQNRVPGRVTRLFGPRASECFFAFEPEGKTRFRALVTGSPLRPEIAAGTRHDDGRTVLVLGGSQGARALNLAALDAAAALTNLRFIVVTGTRDYDWLRSLVRSANCVLVDFIDRPEELYAQATIAVSRAGGMVLSELVAFGIPAILVPFPHATDRHQDANARYLASLGAAIVLDQNRLSGLVSTIRELIGDEQRLRTMALAARRAARPDASRTIAERILQCLAA